MTATLNTTVAPIPISESTTSAGPTRTASARIPLTRIVGVELRKMFDTRSGFWLMASIVITSVLATAAIIVFAPDDQLTFDNFAAAIGAPMTVILPMIGILAVTSEWSQRSGLTTFTLVPHRGRVIGAKFLAAITVGVASMFIALVVGVLGTLVGSAIAGVDPVWNVTATDFGLIVAGQRPGDAVRLHARPGDPQLGGRHRHVLRLHAGAAASARPAGGEPEVVRRPAAVGGLQLRAKAALRRRRLQPTVAAPRRHRWAVVPRCPW